MDKSNPDVPFKISLQPETWFHEYGESLFRYALCRVRNPVTAEDLVQETLLAALKAKERFAGRSSVRSWLTSILRHKIIDTMRKSHREQDLMDGGLEEHAYEDYFDRKGQWKLKPNEWLVHPHKALEQKEFHDILQNCLTQLPPRLHAVFTLREIEEMEAEEICALLNITPTNLWVALHRARERLRVLLQQTWLNRK